MKTIIIFIAAILFCSATAYALTAESDTDPGRLTKSRGVTYYNYDIQQIVEETDSGTRTFYRYSYVIIEGKVTKQKIDAALDASDPLTIEDLDQIETDYKARLEAQ